MDRFWDKVKRNSGTYGKSNDYPTECWVWIAAKTSDGYGRFRLGNTHVMAHRFAYETEVGTILPGQTMDHLCRNRACVRPEHLEPVSMRENLLRGDTFQAKNAAKTHCKYGHEFSAKNTAYNKVGGRICILCRRARWKRYYASRKDTPASN